VPAAAGSGPIRLPAEERRTALLDAALEVIARSGFAGTTLRDVAAEAGVAHGLLRHHFGTREALLAAAFDRAATSQLADLANDPDDPLVALVRYLEPSSEHHWLLWVDAWSEAPRNADLLRTLVHHHRACENHVRVIVEVGSAAGLFVVDDLDAALDTLVALQDGLAVHQFSMGLIDRDTAMSRLLDQAEQILGIERGALRAAAIQAAID
jgi:AcrR family transcriptional regulator